MSTVNEPISRRRALALGGSLAGGLIAASSPLLGAAPRAVAASARDDGSDTGNENSGGGFSQAIIRQMEDILQTSGMQQNGLLSFEIDRTDLQGYTVGGSTISPAV